MQLEQQHQKFIFMSQSLLNSLPVLCWKRRIVALHTLQLWNQSCDDVSVTHRWIHTSLPLMHHTIPSEPAGVEQMQERIKQTLDLIKSDDVSHDWVDLHMQDIDNWWLTSYRVWIRRFRVLFSSKYLFISTEITRTERDYSSFTFNLYFYLVHFFTPM